MPLVSIVVPVYNAEAKLARCVDSLRCQTVADLEILLVDDGSKDNSGTLCDALSVEDARIRAIHQSNGGVSAARNRGLDEATGEWIMFVDADDWLDTDTVELLLHEAREHRADVSVCGLLCEYERSQIPQHIQAVQSTPKELIETHGLARDISGILCSPCNKLYRSAIIQSHELRFPDKIKFGEDFIFNSRVLSYAQRLCSLNRPLYHYDCSDQNSAVHKLYPEYDDFVVQMEAALERFAEQIGVEAEAKQAFCTAFIAERWQYITDVCLESDLSDRQKAEMLMDWYRRVPKAILDRLYKTSHRKARIFDALIAPNPKIASVAKAIRQVDRRASMRKRINACKRMIRKGLVK